MEPRQSVLCVAPHPDDETLGCGGTLLRHVAEGANVHWLIASTVPDTLGWSAERIARRDKEIQDVARRYAFSSVTRLKFPAARLETVPKSDFVAEIAACIASVKPEIIYVPYRNDAHSDHAAVFDAATACTKVFRYPFIRQVLSYEVISETDFGLRPDDPGFRPNSFVDISGYLDEKIDIMRIYESEIGQHPFPRSVEAIRASAILRGAQAGTAAAEAFLVLKSIR